jgi:NADH:ubiquinone oxidoreductase subunit F (NADH-binding)
MMRESRRYPDDRPIRSSATGARIDPPIGAARLLRGIGVEGRTVTLDEHLDRWGSLPTRQGETFIAELERSGLRGHGGAWFPVAAKWRSVARGRGRAPVVVANGTEGEPASGKDRLLLHQLPHLVLDGATVAAATLGARQVVVHVHRDAVDALEQAIVDRRARRLDPVEMDIVVAPDRYLAGQESAAVNTVIGRGVAIPSFTRIRSVRDQGVDRRPTLVQNVETLAHAALIARFGGDWFAEVGTPGSSGTVLLTVTGRWPEPRIIEAPLGSVLGGILGLGDNQFSTVQAVLLGGYGGGWLTSREAMGMALTEEAARQRGSSLGPGIVALLPHGVCPLSEVSRVATYMAGQGAGQCGPCVNGLADLARSLKQLAFRPESLRGGVDSIAPLCDLVDGRGACGHPDGVARFVRSSLRVFADHAILHARQGSCSPTAPFLPVPAPAQPRSVMLR